MNSQVYAEVYQVLQYLPENEYCLIPEEKVRFFEKNRDKRSPRIIWINSDLEDLEISVEAQTILLGLFDLYIANSEERTKIKNLFSPKEDKPLGTTYGQMLENIYEDKNEKIREEQEESIVEQNSLIVLPKPTLVGKIKNFFHSIFKRKK